MPLTTPPGATALVYARNKATGQTYYVGSSGPAGPPAVIIGDFGVSKTPAALPGSGIIPADWDEAGDPAHQMVVGEALIYLPADHTIADAGHLYSYVGSLSATGWVDAGKIQGPQGVTGVSSVIVGDFGAATTPVDLPPDGLIPVDFDGPGQPATPFQMEQGWSLYYDKPTDPLDGHLFQYVGTTIDAAGWIDIGLIQGPPGPPGQDGPMGPPDDEVEVGPDQPTFPPVELWFDTDDDRILGPVDLPTGGAAYDTLAKVTDLDGDIGWQDPFTIPSGKVIQFPNVADVPKINLYGSTFGFGIESGTLTLFASSNIRFRQNSIAGERFAEINGAGIHIDGTLNPSTTSNVTWASGWSGTATCRYNPAVATIRLTGVSRNANCDVNVQTKLFDYPSGFPAPPDVQTGYRTIALERNDNFTRDGAGRFITLHLDGSAVWLIATGDVFYANKKFDAVITWAR